MPRSSSLSAPPDEDVLRWAWIKMARAHLAWFIEYLNPTYERARHTERICSELEAVERGETRRLAIFLPPRHSKTLHVSQYFPAWYLGKHPDHQVIIASYGAELAEANSRVVRNIVQHPKYPFDVKVAHDSSAVNRWATDANGQVIAAGVGGAMTGFGAHLMIIDDPVKGREEADSETYRERAWEWYTEVARTRLMPGGRIVLCQTRWHADDLAGRLLSADGRSNWTVLELPAVADDQDDLGRRSGEPLWPEWFGRPELSALRDELGSRAWAALYQQRPTADEGGLFKRAWFTRRYEDLPELKTKIMSVDSAFKTGVANDYSAIATWGSDGVDYYLVNVVRARVEFPELVGLIQGQYREHRPNGVLIEDTASGQAAIQMLKRVSAMPIIPIKVTAPKEARAAAVSPICEALKVVLPTGAAWVPDWIDEHAAFPTGQHDDMVDTTSMALARLAHWSHSVSDQPREWKINTGARSGKPNLIEQHKRHLREAG